MRSSYSNIKFSTLCRSGLLVDSVRRINENNSAYLIVLGITGVSGAIENMLGSNASALVSNINEPMMTTPKEGSINSPKHIVAAAGQKKEGEEKIFSVLTRIDFLSIVNEDDQTRKKINRLKASGFDSKPDDKYKPFHFKKSESSVSNFPSLELN